MEQIIHGEYPTGCGIRTGDTVYYRGPGNEAGIVIKVDYTTHLALIEWPSAKKAEWETFASLWVEAETIDA